MTEPTVRARIEAVRLEATRGRRYDATRYEPMRLLSEICDALLDLPALEAEKGESSTKMAALRNSAQTNDYMADVLESVTAGSGEMSPVREDGTAHSDERHARRAPSPTVPPSAPLTGEDWMHHALDLRAQLAAVSEGWFEELVAGSSVSGGDPRYVRVALSWPIGTAVLVRRKGNA